MLSLHFDPATRPALWASESHSDAQGFDSLQLFRHWGDNSEGQATVPAGLSGVTAIAAGGFHSLALKSDGTVVGWSLARNLQFV